MNSKLENDLANKLDARFRQACRDHVTLCEIAEIDGKTCASIMFATIGAFFTEGVAKVTDMTPETFGETMAEALRKHRAKRAAA